MKWKMPPWLLTRFGQPPHPWLPICLAVAALLVSITSATFTGFNYLKSNPFELNQKHIATKNLIGVAISEGEDITKDWSTKDPDKFRKEANLWTNRIGHLVEDAYGKGEASLLMSDAGYISYSDGKKQTGISNWIVHRLQRLNELLTRIDSLPMQPDFDPKHYRWAEQCPEC
jgi:hypothetical protein